MQPDRSKWPEWARFLQRWGLDEPAAAVLETAGPLTLILAQTLYLGQPFLDGSRSGGLSGLARLLEDREETQRFAAYLREDLHA